jgi:NADH:ubiquinone oxidoreductase subunit 6 (subunit J)
MGQIVAFYTLAALILGLAVAVVTVRNTVYSVLFLVANFLCVAMLYVTMHAEFIAVIQVLVYAGGIVVLYLFVVMLVNLRNPEAHADPNRNNWLGFALSAAVAIEFGAIALYTILPWRGAEASAVPPGGSNVAMVGQALYVDYLVPFEVASILLLVAMIGAIVLAKREL